MKSRLAFSFILVLFLILHRQCLLLLLPPVPRVDLSYHPSLLDTRLPHRWGREILRMKLAFTLDKAQNSHHPSGGKTYPFVVPPT